MAPRASDIAAPIPRPTASLLLSLVNLPVDSSSYERTDRLATLKSWSKSHPALLSKLLTCTEYRDKKAGCMPLHWAAGTGFDEAVDFLLQFDITDENDESNDTQDVVHASKLSVNQHAQHPSTQLLEEM